MAHLFIDFFETVKVDVEAGEGILPAMRVASHLGHFFAQITAIGQAGERVEASVMEEFFALHVLDGELTQITDSIGAGNEQEDIAEDHPAGVFKPPPGLDSVGAEDGVRQKETAKQMIDGDGRGGDNENLPIEIEGEEGE